MPPGTKGSVQRLVAHSGGVYALVARQYVLHSAGGRFEEVLVFYDPIVDDLQASRSGHAALVDTYGNVQACAADCARGRSYAPLGRRVTSRGLCGSADLLGIMVRAPDASTSVYAELQDVEGEWALAATNLPSAASDCVRARS